MDDPMDRYASLVTAYVERKHHGTDLGEVAAAAADLAEQAGSTWLRVQARALAAAARAVGGGALDAESIVDAALPAVDETVRGRLDDLLPGIGGLTERLAAHEAATRVPGAALEATAHRFLRLFRERSVEDLELGDHASLALRLVEGSAPSWRARLEVGGAGPRLLVNTAAEWTVGQLVDAISTHAYPGVYLVELMRPSAPEWSPSPETTVDLGLAAIGREAVLADHELAREIELVGRGVGARWDGERIVAVERLRRELLPAVASAAMTSTGSEMECRLQELGIDSSRARRLVGAWRDPLERARFLAEAAGPPLVRSWLQTTGQTNGLRRLLGERLVPTMLRTEMAGAAG